MRLDSRCAAVVLVGLLLGLPASGQPDESQSLMEATIDGVHAQMRQGELSCRELVQFYLDRIEAYDKRPPKLNAIQTINPNALERADELDASFADSGLSGSLHCVPVLLKDQVETSDMPTSYGSAIFRDFVSGRDATIVSRMREAGAIILAKTTMGEFASRYVGSAFGIIRNAYDPRRNPSGSSGGTASGVAANFGLVGIGEDTGGSIRGPAAVSNLVGLRPSVPLVSRYGMMPATPNTDTLGPMTRTVRDAALVLDVIAGYDEHDSMTAFGVGRVPESFAHGLNSESTDGNSSLAGTRIGVIREPMDDKTDPESEDYVKVRAVVDGAYASLAELGVELVDPATVPDLTEIFSERLKDNNFSTEDATNDYLAELSDPPVQTLQAILLTGRVTPWRASGLIRSIGKPVTDADYLRILLAREDLRMGLMQVMAKHRLQALAYATFDHQPTLIADDVLENPDTEDGYGLGSNRGLSPASGFPAITVPAGFTVDGLPVGLELLGRPFSEASLLRLAYLFEQATRHRMPPSTTPHPPR